MNYKNLIDDIWSEIFSYLDLKSIYILEVADKFFKNVLKRTNFWKIKARKEFPYSDYRIITMDEEKDYYKVRKLYWNLYWLNHKCNICKLCFIENVCSDIPDCRKCDWLNYLDTGLLNY